MALGVDGVVDGGVGGEKSLGRFRELKPLHSSLSLANWKMRILGTIVLPAAKVMAVGKSQVLQGSPV